MKRFLAGAGWCLLMWIGALMLGGTVLGGVTGITAPDAETAFRASEVAGENFGARYGNLILLGAIVASTVGTVRGWLPGTQAETAVAGPIEHRQSAA